MSMPSRSRSWPAAASQRAAVSSHGSTTCTAAACAGVLRPTPRLLSGLAASVPCMPLTDWERALEARHGKPIDQIPGTIYALHYDPPAIVQSVSSDYAGPSPQHNSRGFLSASPIRHYVGWTQQANPRKRIDKHHNAGTPVTWTILGEGTQRDEQRIKASGRCSVCGDPFRDSLALPPRSVRERKV